MAIDIVALGKSALVNYWMFGKRPCVLPIIF